MRPKRPRVIRGGKFTYILKTGRTQIFDSSMPVRRMSDSESIIQVRNIPHIQEREPKTWTGLPRWKKRKLAVVTHIAERRRIHQVRLARKEVDVPDVGGETGKQTHTFPSGSTKVFPNDVNCLKSSGERRWSLEAVDTNTWEGPVLRRPYLFEEDYDGDESEVDHHVLAPSTGRITQTAREKQFKKCSSRGARPWWSRLSSSMSSRLRHTWRKMTRIWRLSVLLVSLLLLPVLLMLLLVVGYLADSLFIVWWIVYIVRHDIDISLLSQKEIGDSIEEWLQRNFDHYWYWLAIADADTS